ncbi:DUF6094 domain-containing protein [Bacillus sp. 1P06AnD]|uniref:DUF6094 domain-containing protein n=1 Tax=Bacillus sp. 1P06AnD TaxID=3132208 RepID=UPI0039A248B3
MARLASESKGGFYATPVEEMSYIVKALKVTPGEKVNLLDPCAGEGKALSHMAKQLESTHQCSCTTYGIELEKGRAATAALNLDHVLACGYEETRISHEAFSALYVNPPFAQLQGKRLEGLFLQDLTDNYLPAGGLLIFNIPKYVLRDVSKTLASRFVDIRVFRFSDLNGHYDRFQQVIVFAKRRLKGLRTTEERLYKEKIEKELINLSFLPKEAITPLDQLESLRVRYTVEQAPMQVDLFVSLKVDASDILASQASSGHYEKVMMAMSSLEVTSSMKKIRPALPLKYTHIASAISAGALPESMGNHMLLGLTKRVQEERKGFNPKNGKEQDITTFKPKSIVRVFSDQGIFNLK